MKKIEKIFAILSSVAILVTSVVSCSSGDDGNNAALSATTPTTTLSEKVTSGSVGTLNGNVLECTDSDGGKYTFTKNSSPSGNKRSAAETGTWTYTEKNKTTPKYSGTYTGDISSSTLNLSLKVEEVTDSSGNFASVKDVKDFAFTSSSGTFSATIPAVELADRYKGNYIKYSYDFVGDDVWDSGTKIVKNSDGSVTLSKANDTGWSTVNGELLLPLCFNKNGLKNQYWFGVEGDNLGDFVVFGFNSGENGDKTYEKFIGTDCFNEDGVCKAYIDLTGVDIEKVSQVQIKITTSEEIKVKAVWGGAKQ